MILLYVLLFTGHSQSVDCLRLLKLRWIEIEREKDHQDQKQILSGMAVQVISYSYGTGERKGQFLQLFFKEEPIMDWLTISNDQGTTLWSLLIARDDLKLLQYILSKVRLDKITQQLDITPLWESVNAQSHCVIKMLLKHHHSQLEPKKPAPDGSTPFTLALMKRSDPIIKLFLQYNLYEREEILSELIKYGMADVVQEYWDDSRDNTNAYFREALISDSVDMVQFLWEKVNCKNLKEELWAMVKESGRTRKILELCGVERNDEESQLVTMSKTYALFNSKVEGDYNIQLERPAYIYFRELDKIILCSFCCLPKDESSKKPIQDLSKMRTRMSLECSNSCKK